MVKTPQASGEEMRVGRALPTFIYFFFFSAHISSRDRRLSRADESEARGGPLNTSQMFLGCPEMLLCGLRNLRTSLPGAPLLEGGFSPFSAK